MDRRGTGLSDKASVDGESATEHWLQDCKAVLDAVGSKAPLIVSTNDSGPVVLQFAGRHPERCSGLIFIATTACWATRSDYPEGTLPEVAARFKQLIGHAWGRAEFGAAYTPSQATNPSFLQWFAKYQRAMASPRAVVDNMGELERIDSRPILSRLHVPTLVIARKGQSSGIIPYAQTRYIADQITGAKFVEAPGSDASPFWETPELFLNHIEEFVSGSRHGKEPDRKLATILFTDLVRSTERAARLGDLAWRQLLDRHDRVVQSEIPIHGGRFVESAGDSVLAIFESPGGAIDCAHALKRALGEMGLEVRAGIHTGEVELRDESRVGGMAVHFAARIMALANAGEVLTSHTVHGILLGSCYQFHSRGTNELKGVAGSWPVYAVMDGVSS
jgi:class 3 adenylate cyclase